jgi:hypothetical protein
MSVQNNQRLIQYVGNGVTTVFATGFVYHDKGHVFVYKETISTGAVSALTLTTHYTLSTPSNPSGGNVTMLAAPTNNERITIARIVPYEQLTDYVNNDQFDGVTHERQMDLIVMQIQQLADPTNGSTRYIKFPVTDPLTFNNVLPDRLTRAGKILGFAPVTGEMILYSQPFTTITIAPPSTGTWIFGSIDGEMQWIETTNCS